METKLAKYKTWILIFLFVTGVIILFFLNVKDMNLLISRQPEIGIGTKAPDFSFPGLDGQMISLSDYKGKVVLVNIWATWCPPCVSEMPSMEKLYNRFKKDNFEILAVSIDALGAKSVAPFMKLYNLTFPALLDTRGSIKTTYRATGVPESFIIDKNGIILQKVIGGFDWSKPEVFSFIEQQLINSESQ